MNILRPFMKFVFTLITMLFVLLFSFSALAQTQIIKLNTLEILLNNRDSIKVLNFWATWCGPCVKELPILEKLNGENLPGVKVILINLDFAEKVGLVNDFLKRKNIKSAVLLLDEVDYNLWIRRVDATWSGAIPATLILNSNNGKRKFIEREIVDGELEEIIRALR